jgi:hypothetical protein
MLELRKMEGTFNEGENMKIIAKTRTQVRGYGIVQPNETIDLDESLIDERIKANFTRADGEEWGEVKSEGEEKKSSDAPPTNSDLKKQLIERTAERMGREAIIAALESAHVTFKMTENTNSLAKKYLRSIGQEVD